MTASILVVDDDTALREMMTMTLSKEGYQVTAAGSAAAAREALAAVSFDLVVTDIYLGDGTGIDLLTACRELAPEAKVILVTAHGTVETAARAEASGAFDYLAKPFSLERLLDRVGAALARRPDRPAPVSLGPESMIIGNDPAIVEVYKAVARVAPRPVPVLIRGETGTGKELVARALHRFGTNPEGPFVAINCGAIPENLLESELFGHRRGSFTGAVADHRGAIEAARNGTVLLDEVGELPPLLQVKLLRFLQSGEVRAVGAERGVEVPVRVIAATHRDLAAEAAAGRFREDFYYRLAAFEIVLPPLRSRRSDIPRLVEHFRRLYVARFGLAHVPPASAEVLRLLEAQAWPGNVRELENVVQRAIVDLGTLADAAGVARLMRPAPTQAEHAPSIGDDLTLEELERLHIEAVLRRVGRHRTRAAAILGIERKSLYRKAERLGIPLDREENEP